MIGFRLTAAGLGRIRYAGQPTSVTNDPLYRLKLAEASKWRLSVTIVEAEGRVRRGVPTLVVTETPAFGTPDAGASSPRTPSNIGEGHFSSETSFQYRR